jgi:hypothetical protein
VISGICPPGQAQEALDKWKSDPGKVFRIPVNFMPGTPGKNCPMRLFSRDDILKRRKKKAVSELCSTLEAEMDCLSYKKKEFSVYTK